MKLSVIVPFYNSEDSIYTTVNSILSQTWSNLEVLLIDDGSTDNGLKVVMEMSKMDKRLRVFQKTNGGVSSARNYGLEMATGVYITFVDADDTINPKMYESMIYNMLQHDADVCVSGLKINGEYLNDLPGQDCLLVGHTPITKIIVANMLGGADQETLIAPSVCRVIIKNRLIKEWDMRFDSQIGYHEDLEFCLQLFSRAQRVYLDGRPFYNYSFEPPARKKRHSLQKKISSYKQVLRALDHFRSENFSIIDQNFSFAIVRFLMFTCEFICELEKKSYKNQILLLKDFYNEYSYILDDKVTINTLPLKCRIYIFLFFRRQFYPLSIVCLLIRIKANIKQL